MKNDVNRAAKLPDYWHDDMGTRLSCVGSDKKSGRTFHSFHEEEVGELLAKT